MIAWVGCLCQSQVRALIYRHMKYIYSTCIAVAWTTRIMGKYVIKGDMALSLHGMDMCLLSCGIRHVK